MSIERQIIVLVLNLGLALARPVLASDASLLQVRITDARTGQPTACNVALRDASGQLVIESPFYKLGFRCHGQFQKYLPPGNTRLRITRGPETRAVEREFQLAPGQTNTIHVELESVVDLRKRGWFAGDSHVHMIHGERTIPVTFEDLALAARAEGLQYLSVCQDWTMENPTPEKLAREFEIVSRPDCLLTWNLEAPKNYYRGDAQRCLGHCWTLGMRGRSEAGADVIQLLRDASAHDYESTKPVFANFESHQLIRAQGGGVFYTHPMRWWIGPWGGQGGYPKLEKARVSNLAVELPLDTLIGPTYDGLDVITGKGEFKGFEVWALLLNHGYHLAAVASSDACFDRPGGGMPGTARTYTYLEGPFSLEAATRAMVQGRTFATTGPLLVALLEGQPASTTFPADGQERTFTLEAWAGGHSTNGLSRVEILRNGIVIHSQRLQPLVANWRTNYPLRTSENAWYCARVTGGPNAQERAISGAFYFETPGTRPPKPVSAQVHVRVTDASTGKLLGSTLLETAYYATLPRDGQTHRLSQGETTITLPATVRLRAEAPGYRSQTLSPVLDNPTLMVLMTRLKEDDLLDWRIYDRFQELLHTVDLTFRLEPRP